MSSNNIILQIGKSIKEGKYLDILYKNKNGEITPFWISILDINANDELQVNIFNVTKDEPLLNRKIFISSILKADILKFSHYEVPEQLIRKIENDRSLDKYEFDRFDAKILSYYLECYKSNKDPFLYQQHLIPQVDLSTFQANNSYQLSEEQQRHILKNIYHNDYYKYHDYQLALCEFSIDLLNKGKFVVAYRTLTFDPVEKTLYLSANTSFNSNFYIKDIKYALAYYTDMSPVDFEASFRKDKDKTIESLANSFKSGELQNTQPEIVVLGYSQIDISHVYDDINTEHANDEMEIPLKAFFQNVSTLDRKKRSEPYLVLYDSNVNIDQLRTIYNSLKYPITYVQGPPGTGKTQTILNIVVNCLTNNKTLLISSNNNVPIDGIKDKLFLGKYNNKEILFPMIRLGNKACAVEALLKIKELYEFETKDVPKETLLFNLKEQSKKKNKILVERLKAYEDRAEITQNLEFVNSLLSKGSYWRLEEEQNKLVAQLQEIPEISYNDLEGVFEVIKDNRRLMQYFYFECLRHIKKLKTKEYSELIEIVYIEDEGEKVKAFNSWIADDKNMEMFTKVFPIILTTNLSSRRLGRRFKFDLLTIDEAGQCDISTSLIPISKCKNMVLIGDTNQLKPIVIFEEAINERLMKYFEVDPVYDYFNNSILSVYRKIDYISNNILLRYHYRCGRKIIDYSNMRFYERKLDITSNKTPGEVKLLNVNNVNRKNKNSQIEEAKAIINYIKNNNLTDVFIITPFRNQEEVINHYLKEAQDNKEVDDSVSCGTIHKIQGQENKTIIISAAISVQTSAKTYDWIKNNSELINVAVTRAKENLIVVTDKKAIDILSRKDDDLYALVDYVEKHGTTEVAESTVNKLTIGFSNNSQFEDEFYRTMQHYCTIRGGRYERNVKIVTVFPEEIHNVRMNKKEFDGVIYDGQTPKVIFEVNGKEHSVKASRIRSDTAKLELLKAKGIQFIYVPNQYVKHYEFIRALMNKLKGEVYQKELFDLEV